MTPEQIATIRKLTGRCDPASLPTILTSLSTFPFPVNYALRMIDWVDLCSILLTELETQLRQAQEAAEAARQEEREACIETVKTLTPYLSKYHSNISSEPTRKDVIEALERRKYLPK